MGREQQGGGVGAATVGNSHRQRRLPSGQRRQRRIGARLLSGSGSEVMRLAERVALTHHERWDGNGYPYALKGADIPLEGRICALADAVEALTSDRPYRRAHSQETARHIIMEGRGSQFDPTLVDCLETDWARVAEILLASEAH